MTRTPAGCYVGDSLILRESIRYVAPRWGAIPKITRFL
jgi:hypothetical protein